MSRSFIQLRRALFGVSCAVVFGFGGTRAFAMGDPELPPGLACPQSSEPGVPYYSAYCSEWVCGFAPAYCGSDQMCYCGYIP
jgi:hypothetical protein